MESTGVVAVYWLTSERSPRRDAGQPSASVQPDGTQADWSRGRYTARPIEMWVRIESRAGLLGVEEIEMLVSKSASPRNSDLKKIGVAVTG